MSIEHSPTRDKKRGKSSPFDYELLTRFELAERLHVKHETVSRRWRKWGFRPVRVSGRVLFPSDQVAEFERRMMGGEVT